MRADRKTEVTRKKRKEFNRDLKQRILIVCEGSKTEPYYFESFNNKPRLTVLDIEIKLVIEGLGQNTDSLVEKAIKIKDKAKIIGDDYSQVWCVFDRDSFPAQNFNRAFDLVKSENKRMKDNNDSCIIDIAYSNEAFELWYLLHFEYRNTEISRKEYSLRLSKHIGKLLNNVDFKYEKNMRDIYNILLPYQKIAIQNSKKLLKLYSPLNPEKDNPSTKVHNLVEELNKLFNR